MRDDIPPIERANADAGSVERGYEPAGIPTGTLIALLGGVVLVLAVICGGLWWLKSSFLSLPSPAIASRSVVENQKPATDAPPLQPQVDHDTLDNWDLTEMHGREDKTFETLGWQRDAKTHRFVVPTAVLTKLQHRQPATRPQNGGR